MSSSATELTPHSTLGHHHRDRRTHVTGRGGPNHPRALSAVPAIATRPDDVHLRDRRTTSHERHPDPPVFGETHLLAEAVRRVAVTSRLWRPAVRFLPDEPLAVRIPGPRGIDVWLRTWLPGQSTGLIDLGGCATAFAVLEGTLVDIRADDILGTWSTPLPAPTLRTIEAGIVHALRGGSARTVSIHAYTPRLTHLVEHAFDGGRLRRVRRAEVVAPAPAVPSTA